MQQEPPQMQSVGQFVAWETQLARNQTTQILQA